MVLISLLRPTADEMELQALAALNNGRALLNIDELIWQTLFVNGGENPGQRGGVKAGQ